MQREISCLGHNRSKHNNNFKSDKKGDRGDPRSRTVSQIRRKMEDHRRTRSQGLQEGTQLIQWDSVQDPVRIERELTGARRQAREASTAMSNSERAIDNSEICQEAEVQSRGTARTPRSGEISPSKQSKEPRIDVTPKLGEISPGQTEERGLHGTTQRVDEISPREPSEVMSLRAMEEGSIVQTPNGNTHNNPKGEKGPQEEENPLNTSLQMDTAQHYLDDNFSDVMRSSVLGSNVSSLFNTTTFNTTQNDHKVMLDWILPDGRNSQLETLKDKHITDFPAPGGTTGAKLVHLLDLEPFYNMKEFLVDLQLGELFMSLCNTWHPPGLTCKKRNFEVDSLMALIQHASIKLKNKIYGRREEQTKVLMVDSSGMQLPPLPFIPRPKNYVSYNKPMSPVTSKNYIKDRAQAAVTYIKEYGNTTLWSMEGKAPLHKLTQ